jgi:hypothetical protein
VVLSVHAIAGVKRGKNVNVVLVAHVIADVKNREMAKTY